MDNSVSHVTHYNILDHQLDYIIPKQIEITIFADAIQNIIRLHAFNNTEQAHFSHNNPNTMETHRQIKSEFSPLFINIKGPTLSEISFIHVF